MRAHRAEHAIATMSRVLGVSTSGYYAWLNREPSNRAIEDGIILGRIRTYHDRSDGTYGAPRIRKDLREAAKDPMMVGIKRVARLMRKDKRRGVCRRKYYVTTIRDESTRPAPDLVDRNFTASTPNQLWIADITYLPTWAGFLYLAVVLDVFSRRIVGWAMASHLRTELVLEALDMALWQRRPDSVIHHSDQGCQYTSYAFGKRCERAGVRPSMGSVGDCYDNAMCESFFATLECELIDRRRWRTRDEARRDVFKFIEGWYNPHRRHSALGLISPAEFERRMI
jgi:putative transposase